MIRLRPDCLVFKMSSGESIPCSAEKVTIELIGDAAALVDEHLIKEAAESVLHYFRTELQRTSVSVAEFSQALEQVLRGFGLDVQSADAAEGLAEVLEGDLAALAGQFGQGCELFFFPRLREELRLKLAQSPKVLRFSGLRGCVKQLTGAKRWTVRCQALSDQIVDYMRGCLRDRRDQGSCALLIQ